MCNGFFQRRVLGFASRASTIKLAGERAGSEEGDGGRRLLLCAKNYRAAESRFREAVEFTPDNAPAHFKLAQALEKLGKIDEARANYEIYLKADPNGEFAPAARKALSQVQANSVEHPK